MPRHAFILGGTGQIGRSVADDLLRFGWNVTVSHRGRRSPPPRLVDRGAKMITFDRDDPGRLQRALGSGADALIDMAAYDREHARQLIDVQGNVGCLVVISSASVYRDTVGRTLDEASRNGFPELPDPIPETNATVDPGPETYSTRKVALERHLLDHAQTPVTILRPCAIHGPGSRHPREWWFVKRVLDRRPIIPLAYQGASRLHTTSVANIAALVRAAIEQPTHEVLNIADPLAPTAADIAASIAAHLGYEGCIAPMDDPSYPPGIGRTPWSVPHPFVLDCRAALDLGYKPATAYAEAVKATCDWLVEQSVDGDWQDRFPVLAAYPRDLFDYAAEDAFFDGG